MQTDFGQINTFDFRTDEQRVALLILIDDSNCDHLCDDCEQMACECEAA